MSSRKLSQHQRRRIAEGRENRSQAKAGTVEQDGLGPLQRGLVIAHFGTFAQVEPFDNGLAQRCHTRANMSVVAGDFVHWRSGAEFGVIEAVEKRLSELLRPDKYGNLKCVAANVSQLIITLAAVPLPHLNLIDRYLVAAKLHNMQAVLLLNKCDLDNSEENFDKILRYYAPLEIPVIKTSSRNGEGIEALKNILRNNTSVFVGQSGVGKSSLIQHLLPTIDIRIGALSEAADKGKHTTTHAQLYHFESGGHCIDSPGVREFGLWHVSQDELLSGFPELAELASQCRFRDCRHHQDPGCAIRSALEKGNASARRFQSYALILSQLKDVKIKSER